MAKKATKNTKEQKKTMIISVFIGLVVISLLILFITPKGNAGSIGLSEDTLAQCLVDAGYVMGGTSTCPHCTAQKELFNGAFESIIIPGGSYVDCNKDTQWCIDAEIPGYPTWVTPQGNHLIGTQQLSTLKKAAGC